MPFSSIKNVPSSIHGKFWIPNMSEVAFIGDLEVSARVHYDLRTDLIAGPAHSSQVWEAMMQNNAPIPIIFGVSDRGTPLTLVDCGFSSCKSTYSGPNTIGWQKVDFFVNRVFIGAHFEHPEQVRIATFSAHFTGFNRWVGRPPSGFFEGQIRSASGPERKDVISGLGEITITHRGSEQISIEDVSKRNITCCWYPSFTPGNHLTFRQVTDQIITFQRLQCLLQGSPVGFDALRFEILEDSTSETSSKSIEALVMIKGYKKDFEDKREHDMLLALPEAAADWPKILERWFAMHVNLESILNLYFAVVFGEHLSEEHKFLFLAQAVEGYHRCKFADNDLKFTKAEWKQRKQRVLESIHPDDREWATEELVHAPKISLKDRLAELTKPLGGVVAEFIKDVSQFHEDVKRVRNKLTHPSPDTSDFQLSETVPLWRNLKILLEISLLRDLGVQTSILAAIAKRRSRGG